MRRGLFIFIQRPQIQALIPSLLLQFHSNGFSKNDGFAPKVNLGLMVRQAHHERRYKSPFVLSLSKDEVRKRGTLGAKPVPAIN